MTVSDFWKVEEEDDYSMNLVNVITQSDGRDDVWMEVWVKKDGCFELRRWFNMPRDEQKIRQGDPAALADSIHLCDVDETIAFLQELKAKCVEKWG